MSSIVKKAWRSLWCLLMVGLVATPTSAQQPPKPDSGVVMAVGNDLVNQYMFREHDRNRRLAPRGFDGTGLFKHWSREARERHCRLLEQPAVG
jgi:hypothetical protein